MLIGIHFTPKKNPTATPGDDMRQFNFLTRTLERGNIVKEICHKQEEVLYE